MPVVQEERCPQNHRCPCVNLCPFDAVHQESFKAPVIDAQKCVDCGICVNACPYRAITDPNQSLSLRA